MKVPRLIRGRHWYFTQSAEEVILVIVSVSLFWDSPDQSDEALKAPATKPGQPPTRDSQFGTDGNKVWSGSAELRLRHTCAEPGGH